MRVTRSARNWCGASNAANAGELDIHQDERGLPIVGEAHAILTGLGRDGLVTLDLQRISHQLEVLGIVLDD